MAKKACKEHGKFEQERPRSKCIHCWLLWEEHLSKELERLERAQWKIESALLDRQEKEASALADAQEKEHSALTAKVLAAQDRLMELEQEEDAPETVQAM